MTPQTQRGLGLALVAVAAVVAVLNLKRVADLNMFPLSTILLVLGIAMIVRAKKKLQNKA